MDKSYNDPVKQKAREKLRYFIARNLVFRKPKDIHVLCFPGAEKEGEEAIEVIEVYDPLGIPRKNIVGLEADKERFERLQKANLGIEVVNATDIEFLEKNKGRKFDVISLDYTSFFTDERMYALDLIAGDELLGNFGVIATNYMGRREHEDAQSLLRLNKLLFAEYTTAIAVIELGFGKLGELESKLENAPFDLTEEREKTLRHIVVGLPALGKAAIYMGFYRSVLRNVFDNIFNEYIKGHREQGSFLEIDSAPGRDLETRICRRLDFRLIASASVLATLVHSGLEAHEMILFWMSNVKPYFLDDSESYSYVSNTGTPMLFDINYFNKHEKELRKFNDFVIQEQGGRIRITYPGSTAYAHDRFDLEARQTAEEFNRRIKAEPIDRIYLGSSYIPLKRKSRLSKENAIYLVTNGVPIDEILATYNGWTKMQLAAFKAHGTMGTYAIGKATGTE